MKIAIRTIINGREIDAAVKPNQTLLEWLRDDLRLRGSREGCGVGVCGSCTVLVDGRPVSSCLMLATNAEAKYVKAIEQLIRKSIAWDDGAALAEAPESGDKPERGSNSQRRRGKSGGERRPPAAKSREEPPRPAPQPRHTEPARGRRHGASADAPDVRGQALVREAS